MSTRPFAAYEWMIAWRYLRARRAEGGVSVMTWISLLGITLAVAALIITLAVRSGFRAEFVDTILGANAHVTVYSAAYDAEGRPQRRIADYRDLAGRLAATPGVTRAAPLIAGQVMANLADRNAGAEVLGISAADLAAIPRVAEPLAAQGSLAAFDPPPPSPGAADAPPESGSEAAPPGTAPDGGSDTAPDGGPVPQPQAPADAPPDDRPAAQPGGGPAAPPGTGPGAPSDTDAPSASGAPLDAPLPPALPGIAIGMDLAQELGAGVGDRIRLISPNGVRTALGTSPRVSAFQVVYIFRTGRYQIDRTRIYLPFAEAQSFFNREGAADEIEVMLADPERVEQMTPALLAAAGPGMMLWNWKDAAGDYLQALAIEDTVMFVLMSILVLIASLNIISGLVMLVKNKGRDIGILRTMGLTQGAILRIFFICGALVGLIGTLLGVVLGCLFALWFDPILAFLNSASGGGVWQPSIRGIYRLPARLQAGDVASAVALSLVLSFGVTLFPARRAARMNPVEALRYE